MIENSSKTPLNFSSLQYTYLDKNSFQYHKGLVRKKEIEKWLLRTSVQCIRIEIDKPLVIVRYNDVHNTVAYIVTKS